MEKDKGTEGLERKAKPKKEGEKKDGGKKTEAKKPAAKKSGKTLRSMLTTVLHDGSFHHEHHYENSDGSPDHKTAGYSSATMPDLHDHMDDHLGGGADGDQTEAAADPGAAAGPGDPAAAAPAAGGAPEEE